MTTKSPERKKQSGNARNLDQSNLVEKPTMVGVGASAGGLAAFEEFLGLMPRGENIAYLLVSHLDPDQDSLLPQLLAQHTTLTVVTPEDGVEVKADHVYVIPRGQYMTVKDGAIRLAPISADRGTRFPLDTLLRSLGQDQKEKAVGIILTGTGADGTHGLRVIKDNGGMVIAQDPETTDYDGMPSSAIATGFVDFVIPIHEIPNVLLRYVRHPYSAESATADDDDHEGRVATFKEIFDTLQSEGDTLDYEAYKPGTLSRRIHRRMRLANLESPREYAALLQRDAEEVNHLQKDLLIGVTRFFRDPEAWEILRREAIPQLFENRSKEFPVRVWVAGCSTGEEAYSLAVLLLEQRSKANSSVPIQIFATDVNPTNLDIARSALYDRSTLSHVSERELNTHFVQESPNLFRAKKRVREIITFAVHDLLRDPPFSRMDMITCRNVLIYFRPEFQDEVIARLHFALNPNGILFLGGSEGVSSHEKAFDSISKEHRIYRRKGPSVPRPAAFAVRQQASSRGARAPSDDGPLAPTMSPHARPSGLGAEVRRWLSDKFAPASVVIDSQHLIRYIHGPLGRYLDLPEGEPPLNLLSMSPPELRSRLRVALGKARGNDGPVEFTATYARHDGTPIVARIQLHAFVHRPELDGHVVVSFGPGPQTGTENRQLASSGLEDESSVSLLNSELSATQDELENALNSLENTLEDLRVTKEESASMNEEFRSTNEELQAAKEELQSLNEELNAVNSELREKVMALEKATSDLSNVLASTDIPTIFLNPELCIRMFSPGTKSLLNLLPSDIGRPLSDITMKFDDEGLLADVAKVVEDQMPIEKEVRTVGGRRYVRRISPYLEADQHAEGAVITWVDIELVKLAEDASRAANQFAQAIVDTVWEPLLTIDAESRILTVNRSFSKTFGKDAKEVLGKPLSTLCTRMWNVPELLKILQEAMEKGEDIQAYELEGEFGALGQRTMLVNSRRIQPIAPSSVNQVLVALEDITESVHIREELQLQKSALERSNANLLRINESLDAFSYVVGHDLKEPIRAVETMLHILEADHKERLPEPARKLIRDARAANDRLSRLVMGLLDLSRASRIDVPSIRATGIRETMSQESCWVRYQALMTERKATIAPPEREVFVRVPTESLSQILGNLILNGIKHNPKSSPHVEVRAGEVDKDGFVEVVVEDNGPGFPPSVAAGFDSRNVMGDGFGLLIAKRTVENLGGRMWIGDRAQGGAAVHFTVPANVPS